MLSIENEITPECNAIHERLKRMPFEATKPGRATRSVTARKATTHQPPQTTGGSRRGRLRLRCPYIVKGLRRAGFHGGWLGNRRG